MLNGAAVSWQSHLQAVVQLPSSDAEYYAALPAGCEIVCLRQILDTTGCWQQESTKVAEDNVACI
jgi:hypothetical protein